MMIHSRKRRCGVLALLSAVVLGTAALGADTLGGSRSWIAPNPAEVKAQAMAWLDQQKAPESVRKEAEAIWSDIGQGSGEIEVLYRLGATFALMDKNVLGLLHLCSKPKDQPLLPAQPWLTDPGSAPLVAFNMRVLYGRWLVQNDLYDEALEVLADLKPTDVVAPATLLFYQSAAAHTLLQKEKGLQTIAKLMEGAEDAPRRYVALARLMEEDLKGLQEDTLDHVARRMSDVRRRLDLGHAGRKVRQVEDSIIESLDKIIKKLEEQQQQGGGGGGGGGSPQDNIRSSAPAPDSVPIGGKGPGLVERKDIGSGSGWGNLPPKEREEALQKLGRGFPAQFREVIEEYFRRVAAEGAKDNTRNP